MSDAILAMLFKVVKTVVSQEVFDDFLKGVIHIRRKLPGE